MSILPNFAPNDADAIRKTLGLPSFPLWHVTCIIFTKFKCPRRAAAYPDRRSSNGDLAVKPNRVLLAMLPLFGGLFLAHQAVAEDRLKVAFVEFSQASGSSWVRANTESA